MKDKTPEPYTNEYHQASAATVTAEHSGFY